MGHISTAYRGQSQVAVLVEGPVIAPGQGAGELVT